MLMMFSRALKKIPLDKIAPFNEDDLLLLLSPEIAIVLKSIMSDVDDSTFSIKRVMTSNKEIFGSVNFEDKCLDFSKILSSRIERFFISKKSQYIFFDQEEQIFLKQLLDKNTLSCIVELYIRRNGKFEKIEFESIPYNTYRAFRKDLSDLKVVHTMKPDRFVALMVKAENPKEEKSKSGFFNFKNMKQKEETSKLNKVFLRYPELKVQNKDLYKKAYRALSKKYHPDVNNGNDAEFKHLQDSVKLLESTIWFKRLKE